MAVPNITETRCRDGSVQARYTRTTPITPSLHPFIHEIVQWAMLCDLIDFFSNNFSPNWPKQSL